VSRDEFEDFTLFRSAGRDGGLVTVAGFEELLKGIEPITTLRLLIAMTFQTLVHQHGSNLAGKGNRGRMSHLRADAYAEKKEPHGRENAREVPGWQ
jgi:hypothetical protein